jgi:hypothetical protein
MKRITATLLTDGSSDRLLTPLIELLLSTHTDLAYQVSCAEGLPPLSNGLKARINAALELFPCDFLFVHRDDEGIGAAARQKEIEANWKGSLQTATLICVIPVRMTEAWLIANEKPIRAAVGNPQGTDALELPKMKDIESEPDPKEILFAALKAATGKNATRKRRFNPHQFRHRVSELTDDLEPLRKLKSFRHLEAQIKESLAKTSNQAD